MDEQSQDFGKLTSFTEALLCSPSVYCWLYSPDGMLKTTNCPQHVYHRIFEHVGGLSYMLKEGRTERTPLIIGAELGILWAVVYEWEEDELSQCCVIGPVFHDEVSNELLSDAIHRYHIDPAWRPIFVQAVQNIPVISSVLFFQYAVMLHAIVTGEKLSRSDLRFQSQIVQTPGKKQAPRCSRHKTYQAEQMLLQMIREGNLNYRSAMEKAGQLSSGVRISTNDPVKRAILSSSNFTALCTRAAIDGGLEPDTAYTVGDSYIQSLTECRTIADVRTVNHTMYEDFIRRVHSQQTDPRLSRQIQSCKAYIETHPDRDLSLENLAKQVNYSEYHLSRKFKEETGINIRDYIRTVRVERAKLLLSSTEMSIREISELLRFSASSHFARVFLEITGQLPQQYRKENYQ